jgi:hypothetical protein
METKIKLDNDTSRCGGMDCPHKEKCLRFTYRGNGNYVPYSEFWEFNENGKCNYFIKNK